MRSFKQWAFYAIGVVLVALLSFWVCTGWHLPVTFLCSGEVFVRHFNYVWHEDDPYDGFNSGVFKMFMVFGLFVVVLLPLLALWRITARPFAGFQRVIYLVVSAVVSVFPIAAAVVATVMVTRLTVDMGITQKRLLGIAVGVACIAVVPLFLYFVCRKPRTTMPNTALEPTAPSFRVGRCGRRLADGFRSRGSAFGR
jgi:hypothetical protein